MPCSRARKLRNVAMTGFGTLCLMLTSACTIVSIEEDRAMRERRAGSFDSLRYVADNWHARLVPDLASRAVAMDSLWPAIAADLAKAGVDHGRQPTEGSAWTFLVKGQGRLVALDTSSRAGALVIAGSDRGQFRIASGPVLVSTALRDAIPALRFDDFPDQMSFAGVNKALNDAALADLRRNISGLKPGDTIDFVGAVQISDDGTPGDIVPVSVRRSQGG